MIKLSEVFKGPKAGKPSPSSPEGKAIRSQSYKPDRDSTNAQANQIAKMEGLSQDQRETFHNLMQKEKSFGGVVPESKLKELAKEAKRRS